MANRATGQRAWTNDDIPNLEGMTALITGANSGIGLEAARSLAGRGARVLMGCRNPAKAEAAQAEITRSHPRAQTTLIEMDLASLDSVRAAAERLNADYPQLHLLINNAGVMFLHESRTADGFEMQLGTNHFGHFALTGLLLAPLLGTTGSRVITVSSTGHRPGSVNFDDLNWERSYNRFLAYFRSKLANLLFTFELQRRLARAGSQTIAVAAHPGASNTNLGHLDRSHDSLWWLESLIRPVASLLTQSAEMGAQPTVRAATDPEARGGDYYGPGGFAEIAGPPVKVGSSRRARDEESARRLWEASAELTAVDYAALGD